MLNVEDFSTPSISVVAAALLDPGRGILMQQRPPGKAHSGLWEFPGGKVEPGESPSAALAREIEEELGITIAVETLRLAGTAQDIGTGSEGSCLTITLFACTSWDGEPEAREGGALAWVAPERVARLAMPPLDYPLNQALMRWLEKKRG
jgi:8-oxo-dGTP diphosphatase